MGSKWRKLKLALGLNLRTHRLPTTADGGDLDSSASSARHSDAALLSPAPSFLKPSNSFSRSSKKTCSICLASMRLGGGQALFTAECSHSFHFQCIASNVKHGNQVCPVCRAQWKEIPLLCPSSDPPPPRRTRANPVCPLHQNQNIAIPEPTVFDDDESLDGQPNSTHRISDKEDREMTISVFSEVPFVSRFTALDNFTVLVHLKAPPPSDSGKMGCINRPHKTAAKTPRTPIDLVTVLDISGSMAGTKLALLKRAMSFVIQNMGPADRLTVVAFSSTARRLFPLRRMSDTGQRAALKAVNSLVANGGTNITEGLRMGTKIMNDRKDQNPVGSIILLSDGQDTYTASNISEQLNLSSRFEIPVHTFGFGGDHDAEFLHKISEISGGTFSLIETEGIIQDAFAQCIGGLLSVVIKDLKLSIDCLDPGVYLGSLTAGGYQNRVTSDKRAGSIDVGDLYADEERDFLISIKVPMSDKSTSLLKIKCVYTCPLTNETVNLESEEVRISRPEEVVAGETSLEVERQKNRVKAAEAMEQARAAAERGDLVGATSILENCEKALSELAKFCHDRMCLGLREELREMRERMRSRHVYEASGRAYILSGLSAHSWQRATIRGGDSVYIDGSSSLVQAYYQTPSMLEMVTRSQANTLLGSQTLNLPVWPHLASQLRPR
ncbi:unnamed protein product [Cuscuta epithymum]|uniref:Uncharacterized protein n=1 Tax=Cuscuta epithymum TaxID=186058 RepID=A0AAV0FPV0_9ASTE|nr:unnamed protein product [Cuscuta epithymum]